MKRVEINERLRKNAKSGGQEAKDKFELMERVLKSFNDGISARSMDKEYDVRDRDISYFRFNV